MSLISNTIAFVAVNFVVWSLIGLAAGAVIDSPGFSHSFNDTDDSVSYSDIKDVESYKVGGSDLDSAGIPTWLITIWALLDTTWLTALIVGWVRGVS